MLEPCGEAPVDWIAIDARMAKEEEVGNVMYWCLEAELLVLAVDD